jgi:hypothetical protein
VKKRAKARAKARARARDEPVLVRYEDRYLLIRLFEEPNEQGVPKKLILISLIFPF